MIINRKEQGLVNLTVLVGMLIIAVSLPVATKLVQRNQENRSRAAVVNQAMLIDGETGGTSVKSIPVKSICTAKEYKCGNSVLNQCNDSGTGWKFIMNCELGCNSTGKGCLGCRSTDPSTCTPDGKLKKCFKGNWSTSDCPSGEICKNGECVKEVITSTTTSSSSSASVSICSDTNCGNCGTISDCNAKAGCRWDYSGNYCIKKTISAVPSPTCSASNCGNCNQAQCSQQVGCRWAGGACIPQVATPASSLVNGECDTSAVNRCKEGTFQDTPDTTYEYRWKCLGRNGGTTATCFKAKPTSIPSKSLCIPQGGRCVSGGSVCSYERKGTVIPNTDCSGLTPVCCKMTIETDCKNTNDGYDVGFADDRMCKPSEYCNASYKCVSKKDDGNSCLDNRECKSNKCVNKVCQTEITSSSTSPVPASTCSNDNCGSCSYDECINPELTGCTWSNGACIVAVPACSSINCGNCITVSNCTAAGCKWVGGACVPQVTPLISVKINGKCSPVFNTCSAGTFEDTDDTDTEFKWVCKGIDGGKDINCSIIKAKCGSSNGKSVNRAPSGIEACEVGGISWDDQYPVDKEYNWDCVVYAVPGNSVKCKAKVKLVSRWWCGDDNTYSDYYDANGEKVRTIKCENRCDSGNTGQCNSIDRVKSRKCVKVFLQDWWYEGYDASGRKIISERCLNGAGCSDSTGCTNTETIATINPSGIKLSASKISLYVGEKQQITATVEPENASNKTVTWSTSNNLIASVSDTGMVIAKSIGTATLTAKTVNGKTAEVVVTVNTKLSTLTSICSDTNCGNCGTVSNCTAAGCKWDYSGNYCVKKTASTATSISTCSSSNCGGCTTFLECIKTKGCGFDKGCVPAYWLCGDDIWSDYYVNGEKKRSIKCDSGGCNQTTGECNQSTLGTTKECKKFQNIFITEWWLETKDAQGKKISSERCKENCVNGACVKSKPTCASLGGECQNLSLCEKSGGKAVESSDCGDRNDSAAPICCQPTNLNCDGEPLGSQKCLSIGAVLKCTPTGWDQVDCDSTSGHYCLTNRCERVTPPKKENDSCLPGIVGYECPQSTSCFNFKCISNLELKRIKSDEIKCKSVSYGLASIYDPETACPEGWSCNQRSEICEKLEINIKKPAGALCKSDLECASTYCQPVTADPNNPSFCSDISQKEYVDKGNVNAAIIGGVIMAPAVVAGGVAAAPAVTSAYYSLGSLAMTKMATLAAGGGVAGKIYQILNTADSVVDMGEMIYGLAICKDNPGSAKCLEIQARLSNPVIYNSLVDEAVELTQQAGMKIGRIFGKAGEEIVEVGVDLTSKAAAKAMTADELGAVTGVVEPLTDSGKLLVKQLENGGELINVGGVTFVGPGRVDIFDKYGVNFDPNKPTVSYSLLSGEIASRNPSRRIHDVSDLYADNKRFWAYQTGMELDLTDDNLDLIADYIAVEQAKIASQYEIPESFDLWRSSGEEKTRLMKSIYPEVKKVDNFEELDKYLFMGVNGKISFGDIFKNNSGATSFVASSYPNTIFINPNTVSLGYSESIYSHEALHLLQLRNYPGLVFEKREFEAYLYADFFERLDNMGGDVKKSIEDVINDMASSVKSSYMYTYGRDTPEFLLPLIDGQ